VTGGLAPGPGERNDSPPTLFSGMSAGAAAHPDAVAPGQRVRVHYNLHHGGFSVISTATNRVIAHVTDITLTGVRFRVQPAGLARIRAEGCRAVCAYAIGTVAKVNTAPSLAGRRRVPFNPYRADTFTCDDEPIYAAPEVIFADRAGWIQPALA
jgi:hypothetical protein